MASVAGYDTEHYKVIMKMLDENVISAEDLQKAINEAPITMTAASGARYSAPGSAKRVIRPAASKPKPPMRRGGYYWLNSPDATKPTPFVSVTEVLNEVAKQDFFVPAAIRKAHAAWSEDPSMSVKDAQATWYKASTAAAGKGSTLHSFYEAVMRGQIGSQGVDNLPTEIRGHGVAFMKWKTAVRPEIIHAEATVFNREFMIAGTGDLWCQIGKDLIAIVDYKTGFLDEFSTSMQESAYQHGEFGRDPVTGDQFALPEVNARFALQTRDNGTYQFVELPDEWVTFKAYLHAWRARRRAENKDEPCPPACWCEGGK